MRKQQRDIDFKGVVAVTGSNQSHRDVRVFRQSGGDYASCGTCTDDNIVEIRLHVAPMALRWPFQKTWILGAATARFLARDQSRLQKIGTYRDWIPFGSKGAAGLRHLRW
jgi:hypothetical protein